MRNTDYTLATSTQIEADLGDRIERIRLARNITQSQLAKASGTSRSTIARLAADDKGISLDSFIRILQALDLTDALTELIPDQTQSPLAQLKQAQSPTTNQPRQRARPKTAENSDWTWDNGDE